MEFENCRRNVEMEFGKGIYGELEKEKG